MKIAWFTPFSIKSAIGEYSRRITNRLAQSHDVELWLPTSEDIRKTELRVIDYGKVPEALERLAQYDVTVYNMGNFLPFHKEIYEISKRHKGIVVLHDVVLHHFFAGYYLHFRNRPGLYLEKMEEFYGPEGRLIADKRPRVWECDHEVMKYPFFEEAIVNAEGVIVHSGSHASLVRGRWLGPVRTIHLPAYCGETAATAALVSGLKGPASSDRRLLLLTVGHLIRNKQIDKVIEVLGSNKDIADRVRYVVIGPYDEGGDYFKEINGLIARYSLESSVQILGYQPDDILHRYLCDADIFINLRFPSMEGASWSLVEQLLTGKPTIVSDIGFFAEIPDECVIKIPPGGSNALAERLRAMLASQAVRSKIGESGRRLAIEKFSIDNYLQGFLQFVEEVRSWRPQLSLIDRVSEDLAQMGADKGMKVVEVVTDEIHKIFRSSAEPAPDGVSANEKPCFPEQDLLPTNGTSHVDMETVGAKTPTVAVCCLFRNAGSYLPRWFQQWQQIDYPADCLRFVCTEGDSTDNTWEILRDWQQENPNVTLLKMDTVTPRYGSIVHPQRMKILGQLANATLEAIKVEGLDYAFWIESDLIFPPEILSRLLRHGADLVAPMVVIEGTDTFYDYWAFRKRNGEVSGKTGQSLGCFQPEYPYHPAYVPDKPFEVDSAGSALLIKAEVLRAGVRFDEDAIVGFCNNARAKGFKVWADPGTTVWHQPPSVSQLNPPLLSRFPWWEICLLGKYQEMVPIESACPSTLGVKEYARPAKLEIGWMARRLKKQGKPKTLDISVGPSEVPVFLARSGLDVVAVVPPSLADFHNDIQQKWDTRYAVLPQEISRLDLDPNSFDQVVCLYGLSLLENPQDIAALQEIVKACRPLASVFLSLPYDHSEFWRRTEAGIPLGEYNLYNMEAIQDRFLNPTGCSLRDFAFIREIPTEPTGDAPVFTHPNNAGIIVLHLEVR